MNSSPNGSVLAKLRTKMSSISEKKAIDTGLAMTLIAVITSLFIHPSKVAIIAALVFLLVTMTAPSVLKPLAVLWFGFAHGLGTIMSAIILSIIYFVIIVPFGWLSQKLSKDAMNRNAFAAKSGPDTSAFQHRNHTFNKNDLLNPY